MKDILKELFYKYNISLTDRQLEQFNIFYNLVLEENKKYNLTAITEKNDFAIKHLLDSCMPYTLIPQNATVIDIGAGAGFPSIPLKILRPDLDITMLDSLNKRVSFLQLCIKELSLQNAKAIHGRAEDFAKEAREKYDVAVSRAVASLNTLSEYCLPFVKVGGKFIALKGSAYLEEIENSRFAIDTLGGEIKKIQLLTIEEIDSIRANIEIFKIKNTPSKYPRGKNLPRLKPLEDK